MSNDEDFVEWHGSKDSYSWSDSEKSFDYSSLEKGIDSYNPCPYSHFLPEVPKDFNSPIGVNQDSDQD